MAEPRDFLEQIVPFCKEGGFFFFFDVVAQQAFQLDREREKLFLETRDFLV